MLETSFKTNYYRSNRSKLYRFTQSMRDTTTSTFTRVSDQTTRIPQFHTHRHKRVHVLRKVTCVNCLYMYCAFARRLRLIRHTQSRAEKEETPDLTKLRNLPNFKLTALSKMKQVCLKRLWPRLPQFQAQHSPRDSASRETHSACAAALRQRRQHFQKTHLHVKYVVMAF